VTFIDFEGNRGYEYLSQLSQVKYDDTQQHVVTLRIFQHCCVLCLFSRGIIVLLCVHVIVGLYCLETDCSVCFGSISLHLWHLFLSSL